VEAAARLERIDRQLGELSEVLRLLAARPAPAARRAPVAAATPPPPVPRPPVTDAEVEVGPFLTLGAVEELHAQISALPAVADVALRGFDGDRALLDVALR
jgi:hypothetical protein